MGDVKLVASTHIPKGSLNARSSGLGSSLNEAPTFILPPKNLCVPEGGTARFEGKVRGQPEPQVTWHKNGKRITQGGRFLLSSNIRGLFSLDIHSVKGEDRGKYTCEVSNSSGVQQITVELNVEGKCWEPIHPNINPNLEFVACGAYI
ncbi:myosin light chain kinase, smooth muscle-like [Antechinus flavipes]|uniref:myosin light chain kinase, smooth muscle-like n=1 Tax=Antechinus flavipes TaxID=38775 RepID=UPI0022365D44|nr:myosin light chain kinase, smooth muscle-like [Antechinus flavipes]XP_051841395.1 myosin light chain kinase, smooth muscle-like [Antechinus flavipes]XP_051841397.1 myosin light chain kinase, smooth muscle-like [Antechinus flavipes]